MVSSCGTPESFTFDKIPPDLTLAVDHALTLDRYIARIGYGNERLDGLLPHSDGLRIIVAGSGSQQYGILFYIELHVALQLDGSSNKSSDAQPNRSATASGTVIDRGLNRFRVLRDSITLGARGAHVTDRTEPALTRAISTARSRATSFSEYPSIQLAQQRRGRPANRGLPGNVPGPPLAIEIVLQVVLLTCPPHTLVTSLFWSMYPATAIHPFRAAGP